MAKSNRYNSAISVASSLAEVNSAATEFLASLPSHKRARIAQRTLTFIPHLVSGTDNKVNDILVRMKLLAAQACAGEIPRAGSLGNQPRTPRTK